MWTPKGRTKSVHNSKVSTLVKLGVAMGHRLHTMVPFLSSHKGLSCTYKENKPAGQKVSTKVGCPQRWGVHRARFYCIAIQDWTVPIIVPKDLVSIFVPCSKDVEPFLNLTRCGEKPCNPMVMSFSVVALRWGLRLQYGLEPKSSDPWPPHLPMITNITIHMNGLDLMSSGFIRHLSCDTWAILKYCAPSDILLDTCYNS